MPLPLRYVKEIHARLLVRYGTSWSTKWAGVDQDDIAADWADQLDGMKPENIRKALESLPADFPPTATAFRALGSIREESKPMAALPAPDPVGARRVAEAITFKGDTETPSQWMERLKRDVLAGNASRARKDHYAKAVANGHYGELAQ